MAVNNTITLRQHRRFVLHSYSTYRVETVRGVAKLLRVGATLSTGDPSPVTTVPPSPDVNYRRHLTTNIGSLAF